MEIIFSESESTMHGPVPSLRHLTTAVHSYFQTTLYATCVSVMLCEACVVLAAFVCMCLSICLSVYRKMIKYWSEIDAICCESSRRHYGMYLLRLLIS